MIRTRRTNGLDMEPNEIIKTLPVGLYTRLDSITPAGALEARQARDGTIKFHWRGALGKKTIRVAIGLYDSRASPRSVKPTRIGYSIAAARRAAEDIAAQHQDNRDRGGYETIRHEQRTKNQRETEARHEASKQTLERLLMAYADRLEAQGKQSHKDARGIFNNHVIDAFPRFARAPAADIEPEDIADMMRHLQDANKGRTANKLRSYVRAAYETAKQARLDASIPLTFKAFNIRHNPAADTVQDPTKNRADKNPLTIDQMILYWNAINALPGLRGAVLRLHLLTGGQRIAQLVRLLTLDATKDTITIFDNKGRPGTEPRPHIVPLIPAARKALSDALSGGHYALSSDGGETHVSPTTVTRWAQDAVSEALPDFQLKQVRSGVETLLSRAGVSKEIRGRLQSHGMAGVQDRHYDGHDYLPEKKKALTTLHRALEKKPANVTPIRNIA